MRRKAAFAASLVALATLSAASVVAEPLRLNVRPRSFLDAGNVVPPAASPNPASARGQMISYLGNPPWQTQRDRFGEGVLPDPVVNGPFVGARSLLGPIDLGEPLYGPLD